MGRLGLSARYSAAPKLFVPAQTCPDVQPGPKACPMSDPIFFDNWPSLLRIPLVGLLAYMALIIMLRASGKRTLSKMNAFDLVVTVALGSTLSTILLNASIPLLEGILALAPRVSLQYAITWLSVRSARVFRVL